MDTVLVDAYGGELTDKVIVRRYKRLCRPCETSFRRKNVTPGSSDANAADSDQPAAGLDLFACQGRESTFDQPGDHADAKSVCHERRLRGAIQACSREHGQRAALLGSQTHRLASARLARNL
jgi:hypothetical protein